jgi:hypothetical protein
MTTRAKLFHYPELIFNGGILVRLLGGDDFSGKYLSVSKIMEKWGLVDLLSDVTAR